MPTKERPRCPACHSVEVYMPEGTAQVMCANCGTDATFGNVSTPRVLTDGQLGDTIILPLLRKAWATCRQCGEPGVDNNDPADARCVTCDAPRSTHLVRDLLDEVGPFVPLAEETLAHPNEVGQQCTASVGQGVLLVGGDPLTRLQVTAVWSNGDVDVVATGWGVQWQAVPAKALYVCDPV